MQDGKGWEATHRSVTFLIVKFVRARLELVRAEASAAVLHSAHGQAFFGASLEAFVNRHAVVHLNFSFQDPISLLVGAEQLEF